MNAILSFILLVLFIVVLWVLLGFGVYLIYCRMYDRNHPAAVLEDMKFLDRAEFIMFKIEEEKEKHLRSNIKSILIEESTLMFFFMIIMVNILLFEIGGNK